MKIYEIPKQFSVPDDLKTIAAAYKNKNFNVYLVGGAVRDIITNDKPVDYDFVSNASADETIKILEELKCKIYYKGKRFGIISGSINSIKIEIGSFRKDMTDSRLPEVEFNVTMEEDASRRDITYNALYYDFDKNIIIDYVNGINDMQNKITRLVGNPELRIRQDKLRILRVIRSACKYNHIIEQSTFDAIKNADLEGISKERIYEEITRAFKTTAFHKYLSYLKDTNLFEHVFQNINVTYDIPIISIHLPIYFAYMFKNNCNIGSKLKTLKYDNIIRKQTKFLINMINFDPINITKYLKRRNQLNIDKNMLIEWNNIMKLGKYQLQFVDYQTIVKKELIDKLIRDGFPGKDLSKKLHTIEYENFIYE